VRDDELLPRSQEFATVGHLYRGIADGLRMLVARFGERAVFVGSPRAQATPELLRWYRRKSGARPQLVVAGPYGLRRQDRAGQPGGHGRPQ
jgi:hypothetical protein